MVGETLGTYRIEARLGEGGMGVVYRAIDIRLKRTVALKVLSAGSKDDKDRRMRFLQEARSASALTHPNIVVIHDINEIGGVQFIVMEYVPGEPLDKVLRHGPIEAMLALSYAEQMVGAVATAHSGGIVHRDLKPANVIIAADHRVKILDFGLAKVMPREMAGEDPTISGLHAEGLRTHAGSLLGTPAYMSPEQVEGRGADHRSDFFSLGVMLYEMLSGRKPFSGTSSVMIMAQVVTHEPLPLDSLIEGLPAGLSDLVEKCMRKSPPDRFQSSAQLKAAFEDIIRNPRNAAAAASHGRHPGAPLIAVVPFVSLGHDPENDYFAGGLAEEITYRLSQLPRLKTLARASAAALRKETDMFRVAQRLGIGYILDGTVRRQGQRIRVSVELVKTSGGLQVWSERFDRELQDIFAVQDEIATGITEVLKVRLDQNEQLPEPKHRPESVSAYQLYLKGRHLWNRRSWESLRKGIENFQQAVDRDPLYTLAYVGIADSYNLLGYYAERKPAEAFPRAKAAALQALQIDETVAEAHASLGYSKLFYDRDWEGAEQEFHRAIQLNPSYSSAHQWRAWYLFAMNRLDEAVKELETAQSLDPLSAIINDHLSLSLLLTGRTEEAIRIIRQILELDPDFALSYRRLGLAWYNAGKIEDAVASMEKAVELSAGSVGTGPLGFLYGRAGRIDEARAILSRLELTARDHYISPLEQALVYGGMCDLDATFREFRRACEDRTSDLVLYHHYPWPKEVRADKRFATISREIGFPDSVTAAVNR